MAVVNKRRPKFSKREAIESDSGSEYDLDDVIGHTRQDDRQGDDLSSVSFGRLNQVQNKLKQSVSKSRRSQMSSDSEAEESSEDGGFFEEDDQSSSDDEGAPRASKATKKKSKHAPTEASAKRPVSKVRDIAGLPSRKGSTLHTDIRFDPAYGKSDLEKTRKNYAFLDDYRRQEIEQMQDLLKANQKKSFLSDREVGDLNNDIQSLRSRLDTLKNRDLEKKVLKDFKDKHAGGGNFFLKKSDKRKLIQKARFEGMKGKQREKVMERKRKKRLGKEFKQMEFM